MTLYLVHHADALPPGVDAERPLSSLGLKQAQSIAEQAKDAGAAPALIWHSGKKRARQTAETCWRVCNPFASFRMVRGLRPEDRPESIADLIEMEDVDLLLVSHMPLLPTLLDLLTEARSATFPQNGLVVLERERPRRYVEKWRAVPKT